MKKPEEGTERFPEVEKAIIDLLESKNGRSNYIILQRSIPNVDGREFRISISLLVRDGKIKIGPLEEIETVSKLDKRMILESSTLSISIILVQE